ncbi:MAG: MotA/TolQ/ExbB proton channel family protein [Burkholderiaceae bacterium]|nr:MAG: MotA/TolQ/ExbB proton channel family protein [Burkholderiaceae bacterium]
MNGSFGLAHFWTQGDWVTRITFAVLVAMSVASWIVMLTKALGVLRARRQAVRVNRFWHAATIPDGMAQLQPAAGNPFLALAEEGEEAATQQHTAAGQLRGALDASDWIARALRSSIDGTTARLQSGLTVLASVGSTAPFVGLFGTVWGIYHALMNLSAAGQAASINQVAGPIGEALIMTAFGLAAAIPAVLGYNALVRANKNLLARLGRFAHELHAYYLTGGAQAAVQPDGKVVLMKHN